MVNGIINIKKEKGFTSHDVVAKLRGIVGQKKIGHTGTLDPDATGVLPVCLGKATKLCDMLTDKNKTYEAVLLLGVETDTQDTSGTTLQEQDASHCTEEEVQQVILSFVGESEQIPPMYSALKVNGKKLYELAREGKVVERKARPITIYDITILEVNLPEVRMQVTCSKGTYIRTLCHDIGQQLGVGGCMKELIRTQVSRFTIADSLTLSQVQERKDEGKLGECILPIECVFEHLEKFVIPKALEWLAWNGNPLNVEVYQEQYNWKDGQSLRLYLEDGRFVGIYQYKAVNTTLKLEKMFLDKEEQ